MKWLTYDIPACRVLKVSVSRSKHDATNIDQ